MTHTRIQDITRRLYAHRDQLDQQARAGHQRHLDAAARGITGTQDAVTHGLEILTTIGRIDVADTALRLVGQQWPPMSVLRHLTRAYAYSGSAPDDDPTSSARRAGWAEEVRHLRTVLADD